MGRYVLGIDVGGTFTDGVLLSAPEGSVHTAKVPSVPRRPNQGFLDCLARLAASLGVTTDGLLASTDLIVHGTTIAVNALLTGSGAKVGLITTKGFRDILEMRRGQRDHMFDLSLGQPLTLVPRYMRFGVNERVDYLGNVLTAPDAAEVESVVAEMKARNVESIAVCLLNSFMNPVNEELIADILKRGSPDAHVSLSSQVLPVIREYERTSTTVMNAYVGPIFGKYVDELTSALNRLGFGGTLLLMHSGGGVMTAPGIKQRAVCSLFSGPAAAPSVALYFAGAIGSKNMLTIDMGGTSFDVTRVYEGAITTTSESTINRYPVSVPSVEVVTIGAGGGSVAWIDPGGMLQVGPRSAGADPGPACYGKGGTEPTVTDANVVLGHINPAFFLGGEILLDAEASRSAIAKRVADPLGISVEEAAWGIYRLVNENMIGAIREMTARRGDYPSEFVMVVGGGAGGVHACDLAAGVGIDRLFVPRLASFLCAFGMISTDLKYDLARSRPSRLSRVTSGEVRRIVSELGEEGNALLDHAGVDPGDRRFVFSVDMRYARQTHEVGVEAVLDERSGEILLDRLAADFHRMHARLYTYSDPDAEVELVTFHLATLGRRQRIELRTEAPVGPDASEAIKAHRRAFFLDSRGDESVPIYDGRALRHGNALDGPALVEDPTTTVLVNPDFRLSVDMFGNYRLDRLNPSGMKEEKREPASV